VSRLSVAGFDYADGKRGYWARLRDGGGRDVILTAHPETLLAMLKAGVLAGEAKADAEKLKILGEPRAGAGS
jgi:hypothetical protein